MQIMTKEKTLADAPSIYTNEQGQAWANGYNDCLEALEAEQVCQAQEPFVWWRTSRDITDEYYTEYTEDGNKPIGNGWQPLYTHPAPAKEFVTLTADEIFDLRKDDYGVPSKYWDDYARAIEAKLKEKNNG
jgi:hypothetical protein